MNYSYIGITKYKILFLPKGHVERVGKDQIRLKAEKIGSFLEKEEQVDLYTKSTYKKLKKDKIL